MNYSVDEYQRWNLNCHVLWKLLVPKTIATAIAAYVFKKRIIYINNSWSHLSISAAYI